MSTTPHTPGPWMVKHAGSADEIWSDRGMVAEISLYPHGSQQADADSRLIATAPELLAALGKYVNCGHHDTCSNALSKEYECDCGFVLGQTAIAKAEGRAK